MYVIVLASMLNYNFSLFGLTVRNQLPATKGLSIGDYDGSDKVDQPILKKRASGERFLLLTKVFSKTKLNHNAG